MVPNLKYYCVLTSTKEVICRCSNIDECKNMAKDLGYRESEFDIEKIDNINSTDIYDFNQNYVR